MKNLRENLYICQFLLQRIRSPSASTAAAYNREPSLSRDEKVFPQSCHDASTQDAIDCDRGNDYNIINN